MISLIANIALILKAILNIIALIKEHQDKKFSDDLKEFISSLSKLDTIEKRQDAAKRLSDLWDRV